MSVETLKSKKARIGRIPENWEVVMLNDVADIKFSNVDKKTVADELPVFLCNYLDVYNNNYITSKINFMPATATEQEIKKFTLMKGDILLTKDSETPDDIAVPSVVIEDLENVICGYHLAMLRPNPNLVQCIYLSKLLLSKPINNQFIRLAHGLTRFGLNVSTFEKVIIPVPPLSEQRKIAEILSTLDDAIEKTDAIIKETQQLKKGLMEKVFTEGIGHTRFKKTKIGRIPEEWQTAKFKEVSIFNNGANFSKHEVSNKGILMADVLNMYSEDVLVDTTNFYRINKKLNKNFILEKGDILFVRSSLKREGVGLSALFDGHHEPVSFCGFLIKARLINSNISPKFLAYYLRAPQTRSKIISLSGTVAITNINQESLGLLEIPIPQMREQIKITNIFSELNDKIENEQSYKSELEQLKKGLSQVLLTGKVRVKV